MTSLAQQSYDEGQQLLAARTSLYLKQHGQYLTPPRLAAFAAQQLGPLPDSLYLLDPALGSGTLVAAVIDRLIAEGKPRYLMIDGYETDPALYTIAGDMLLRADSLATTRGILIEWSIQTADFIDVGVRHLHPTLFEPTPPRYSHIIANPPYFKLGPTAPQRQRAAPLLSGHTNIYTLFMALSAKLLEPDGRAVFIVPRSFCSGDYFEDFRREFVRDVQPVRVHVFESRRTTFSNVLQENIVLGVQGRAIATDTVTISSSESLEDLTDDGQPVPLDKVVGKRGRSIYFRLPTSDYDHALLEVFDGWSHHLPDYGWAVSTGPVVPFRQREFISERGTVPLLWLQNVHPQRIEWEPRRRKPAYYLHTPASEKWLVPRGNYVLTRRFSAKEEARRLVAAPLLTSDYAHDWIGLENHLNYIHRNGQSLTRIEAIGLSAFLDSRLADGYVRVVNGNTQVNAAELRALPLPPLSSILRIGETLDSDPATDLDALVMAVLIEDGQLAADFATIHEMHHL